MEVLDINDSCRHKVLMYFRDLFIIKHEIIEKAIILLEDNNIDTRIRAMNYLAVSRYSGLINYNGKEISLADRVKMLLNEADLNSSLFHYALDYLGNIRYNDYALEKRMLTEALKSSQEGFISDRETIMRYLLNVGHFSGPYFKLVLHYQAIRLEISMGSSVSDKYFDKIDKYVPSEKLNSAREMLYNHAFRNIIQLYKIRKQLSGKNSDRIYGDQQRERLIRTSIALQKLLLVIDEKQKFHEL